jgi:hypothetical protein
MILKQARHVMQSGELFDPFVEIVGEPLLGL